MSHLPRAILTVVRYFFPFQINSFVLWISRSPPRRNLRFLYEIFICLIFFHLCFILAKREVNLVVLASWQTVSSTFHMRYMKAIKDDERKTVTSMRSEIMACYCHAIASDEFPNRHQLCPKSEDSWCFYKRAQCKGEIPRSYSEKSPFPCRIPKKIVHKHWRYTVTWHQQNGKTVVSRGVHKTPMKECTPVCRQNVLRIIQ